MTAGLRDRSASSSGIYVGFMGVRIRTQRKERISFHWFVLFRFRLLFAFSEEAAALGSIVLRY